MRKSSDNESLLESFKILGLQQQECLTTIQALRDEIAKKETLLSNLAISRDREKSIQTVEAITLYINHVLREFTQAASHEAAEITDKIAQHNHYVELAILFGAGEEREYLSRLQGLKLDLSASDSVEATTQDYLSSLLLFLEEINQIHETPVLSAEHALPYQRLMLLFTVSIALLNNHASIFLHIAELDQIHTSLEEKIAIEEEKLALAQSNLAIIIDNMALIQEECLMKGIDCQTTSDHN